MHDYFEILGLSSDARASEVRRAWARRVRRSHPDFPETGNAEALTGARALALAAGAADRDLAIDFADVSLFLDRMQAAFFADRR